MRYTPMRCTPSEMHAHKVHAHEVHANKIHTHEVYAYEVHTYNVHTHEMQVYEVHAYKVHAHEMHIFKIHAYDNPSKCNLPRALHLIGVRTFRFSIWFWEKVLIPNTNLRDPLRHPHPRGRDSSPTQTWGQECFGEEQMTGVLRRPSVQCLLSAAASPFPTFHQCY
jgi:hypothetical protein